MKINSIYYVVKS